MRLWAEERKTGTIELLMTLPVTLWEAVLGKFLAAWVFTALALALTFPIWITVNYLGNPDNGVIFAAYIGSLLLAGGFLAIGSCMSALTRNQVIAFILAVVACFVFLLAGFPLVLDVFRAWAPQALVDAVASLSFLTHFESIAKGVIDLRDLLYFAMLIALLPARDRHRARRCESGLGAMHDETLNTRRRRAARARRCCSSASRCCSTTRCAAGGSTSRQNRLYTTAPGTDRILNEHQGADQSLLLLLARRPPSSCRS